MSLKLYHAPHSRSSRIINLLFDLGVMDQVEIVPTSIPRRDGSGGRDPANPHPEGKVPLLIHDGVAIWESGAIIQYLCELFPDSGLGVPSGHPQRGRFLSWLHYYGSVMEPVIIHRVADLSHPVLSATLRGFDEMTERLASALRSQPYLMGEHYTAADLLVHSPFAWFSEMTPDDPVIRDWVDRCMTRDATGKAADYDARLMAAA